MSMLIISGFCGLPHSSFRVVSFATKPALAKIRRIEQNLCFVKIAQFAAPVLPARGMAQETAQIDPVAVPPWLVVILGAVGVTAVAAIT
jgi:hypothetical protein